MRTRLILGDLVDSILETPHGTGLQTVGNDIVAANHAEEVGAAELPRRDGETGDHDRLLVFARRIEHLSMEADKS